MLFGAKVRNVLLLIFIAAIGLALGVRLSAVPGSGADYFLLRQITMAWLSGRTQLFDSASRSFYNAPWLLWAYVPFTWIPPRLGQAIWITLSMFCILSGLRRAGSLPLWVTVLAFGLSPVLSELLVGQVDGLLLSALALGLWATQKHKPWALGTSLIILAAKPVNVVLPGLVLLGQARSWGWRDWLKVAIIPAAVFTASLLLWGAWPMRYVAAYMAYPPEQVVVHSVWRMGWMGVPIALLGLALAYGEWRQGECLNAAQIANFAITPYSTGPHLVLLVPWWARLTTRRPGLGILLWAVTWLIVLVRL